MKRLLQTIIVIGAIGPVLHHFAPELLYGAMLLANNVFPSDPQSDVVIEAAGWTAHLYEFARYRFPVVGAAIHFGAMGLFVMALKSDARSRGFYFMWSAFVVGSLAFFFVWHLAWLFVGVVSLALCAKIRERRGWSLEIDPTLEIGASPPNGWPKS